MPPAGGAASTTAASKPASHIDVRDDISALLAQCLKGLWHGAFCLARLHLPSLSALSGTEPVCNHCQQSGDPLQSGQGAKQVDEPRQRDYCEVLWQPAGRRVRGLQEARQEGEGGGGTALAFVLKLASL